MSEKYLIVAGGTSVTLPDSVREVQFFKDLVSDGIIVIDVDKPDVDTDETAEKRRGRPPKQIA